MPRQSQGLFKLVSLDNWVHPELPLLTLWINALSRLASNIAGEGGHDGGGKPPGIDVCRPLNGLETHDTTNHMFECLCGYMKECQLS